LEELSRQKSEHTKAKMALRRGHYDLTTQLGQLRDESRAFRDRASRFGRVLAELRRASNDKQERAEAERTKLGQFEREIDGCNHDMGRW
jgi:chromosome segregation ATPase